MKGYTVYSKRSKVFKGYFKDLTAALTAAIDANNPITRPEPNTRHYGDFEVYGITDEKFLCSYQDPNQLVLFRNRPIEFEG